MKFKREITLFAILLGLILCVGIIPNNYSTMDNQEDGKNNVETRDEMKLKCPHLSKYWDNFTFIHIDKNWTKAVGYGWCQGDGSWEHPYIIENMTIDASTSLTGSGIFINNSKDDYFIIRNCTVYNAGGVTYNASIKLENTNNGTLVNNNCSNNRYGILLINNCENNTILENTAYYNIGEGLYLRDDCDNNTILENNINYNTGGGIYIRDSCDNNTVLKNYVYDNSYTGIFLYNCCTNNIISRNIVISNNHGIRLSLYCNNTIISGNTLNENNAAGILFLDYCNNNTILGNAISRNAISGTWAGIYLEYDCDNNNITENSLHFNNLKAIKINSDDCDNNLIRKNVLISINENYIDDLGDNTIIMQNYFGTIPPSFYIEIINQSFSLTEFLIIIRVVSEISHLKLTDLEYSDITILMWWNGFVVQAQNISKLDTGLYNISLTPILIEPSEDPILLNMTISEPHHGDKYFELKLAVDPEAVEKPSPPQPPVLPSNGDGGGDGKKAGKAEEPAIPVITLVAIGVGSIISASAIAIFFMRKKKFAKRAIEKVQS